MIPLLSRLKDTSRPIVLYGTGNGADKAFKKFEEQKITVDGIFASDSFKRNRLFHSFPVLTLSEIDKLFHEPIIVMVFGSSRQEVIENVINIKRNHDFYCFHIPVYDDVFFDMDFARKNRERLVNAYDLLADDLSKKTFENDVLFSLTGDVDYLFSCETPTDKSWEKLNLTDDEIYMDLGAYNGDTVKRFLSMVNDYGKIYAVEPDKKNFAKLKRLTDNMKNAQAISCLIGENDEDAFLSKSKGRGTSKGIDVPIRQRSVDSILNGEKATFLKFDVEGEERNALLGAKETIKNFKPKMCVSAYHKSEDLFEIVETVMAIRPDYKIYLRRDRCIPDWDMCYYFV